VFAQHGTVPEKESQPEQAKTFDIPDGAGMVELCDRVSNLTKLALVAKSSGIKKDKMVNRIERKTGHKLKPEIQKIVDYAWDIDTTGMDENYFEVFRLQVSVVCLDDKIARGAEQFRSAMHSVMYPE
jgi:hypothetical protein